MSQQKNNHFSRKIIAVLEIIATFARDYQINPIGEVLEWLKRHAWKACSRQNRLAGSNPVLSARASQHVEYQQVVTLFQFLSDDIRTIRDTYVGRTSFSQL